MFKVSIILSTEQVNVHCCSCNESGFVATDCKFVAFVFSVFICLSFPPPGLNYYNLIHLVCRFAVLIVLFSLLHVY